MVRDNNDTGSTPAQARVDSTDLLLEKLMAGDHSPLGLLLHKASSRVKALIVLRMSDRLRRRMEPEDVLQEVYVEALKQLPGFENRGKGSFYAWFAALTVNKLLNLEQYAAADRRDPHKEAAVLGARRDPRGADSNPGIQVAAAAASPSHMLMRSEDYLTTVEAIRGLAERERNVVMLRYLQGLSSQETARAMGLTTPQVYVVLSRAMTKIRATVGCP